jgi:hypothetical protein
MLRKIHSGTRELYTALKLAPKSLRWLVITLILIALIMLPWLIVLGVTLQGQAEVRMWSSTWIGLDCLEIAGLITTALLLVQRKALVVVAATFTATLFLIDAWFDVMLSQAGADWYQALFTAFLGELPLSIICLCIALAAPSWCKDRETRTND